MKALLVAVVAATVASGAAIPAAADDHIRPQVVVAVADTGVNPYHEVYYRPQNTDHPCTWVTGFDDCNIPALNLSIGTYASYEEAVAADAEVWAAIEPHEWYWIPKTNIIGAVCDGTAPALAVTGLCILDEDGHGTGTTSSVLSEAPDALLLVHEGNGGASDLETAPVAPDIQSHSWATSVPVPLHAAEPVIPGESAICDDGAFSDETIFFIAAGNEAPMPAIADCYRVNNRVQIVGGAYPGYVDGSSYSTYDFASWYCRPAASSDSVTGTDPAHCGTSFAAPTVAGTAAAALLEIRRHENYTERSTATMVSTTVSRDAFIGALRNGASYTPEAKFPNRPTGVRALRAAPLPAAAPYLFWGYGWLDSTVTDRVVACALGGTCPVPSPESEAWNASRRQFRSATYDDAPLPSEAQDDAGSGRDAGATRSSAAEITPGGSYTASLEPYAGLGDSKDWFTFDAAVGQDITIDFEGPFAGWELLSPDGDVVAYGSELATETSPPTTVRAAASGQYVLSYFDPYLRQAYQFTVATA